ncbi:helix-turn-helix domain-containing protein [Peribacillus sp. TH16]|uniref:sugar diacid recognition domain-containing protein n=1 Tax=Peribacillus sp. TH16 TaxID=2798482 RepID=UPI001912E90E|nr:sugar diacid recognition domain-containing protein [Peribacillus sp. TH16]MBK5482718.1 helix-turn-helix domain-containing protein [Peribacillus sp. TH16]
MLKKIAQELATSVGKATECEVAIIDKESIIIGSSDLSRIGLFNEGSVEVIRTGKPLLHKREYIKHMINTKPGHCFPIFFQNDVIGAVGIVGVKEEVRKYTQLVQSLAEYFMKTTLIQLDRLSSFYAHNQLIKNITTLDTVNGSEELLIRKGFEIGIDLRPPHICIALDIINVKKQIENEIFNEVKESPELGLQLKNEKILSLVKQVFYHQNDICASITDDKVLILHVLDYHPEDKHIRKLTQSKCTTLIKLLKKEGVTVLCGISNISHNISSLNSACELAWLSLEVGMRLRELKNENIFFAEDYFIETVLISNKEKYMNWHQARLLINLLNQPDSTEILRTIRIWVESGFKVSKAADLLFIHRNTLIYRLNKIEELSGLDMNDPKKVINLYLVVLRHELLK